jgi:hypothetical protein
VAGFGGNVAARSGVRSGNASARRHSAIPSHQTKVLPVTSPARMSCVSGAYAIGPTWEPRTIANQLGETAPSSGLAVGTLTVARHDGH